MAGSQEDKRARAGSAAAATAAAAFPETTTPSLPPPRRAPAGRAKAEEGGGSMEPGKQEGLEGKDENNDTKSFPALRALVGKRCVFCMRT